MSELTDDIETIEEVISARNIAYLFQSHYDRIYTYLRYRVSSLEDAEDLVGTVFERAYSRREQFDPQKGTFSAWLFRIAHNTMANYYRDRERRAAWEEGGEPPEDLAEATASPESLVIAKEAKLDLLKGLGQLSDRDQEVISLKFVGKLSNREIGEIMDLKEKTVSVVLLRAMRRLRQVLEKEAIA